MRNNAPRLVKNALAQQNEMSFADRDRLQHHNQFVIGPCFVKERTAWQQVKIAEHLFLTAHPDMNIYHLERGNKSLTLIGIVLDPYHPKATESEIAEELIQSFSDYRTLFNHTKHLAGRWAIVAKIGNEKRIFNDPVGLRQIFYSECGVYPETWCASQPGIIADILGLEMSPEGIEYINSYEFRINQQFRWPGASTPYEEITHLMPNHSLDLVQGSCKRYWPVGPLKEIPVQDAVEKCCALLRGILESAANRFELALGITAGLDSRMVLAASKDLKNVLSYVTVREIGVREDHADIHIPSLLLSKMGLPHDVVRSSMIVDDEFMRLFRKNTAVPHPVYANDAYAILEYYRNKYGKQFVVLTGSASEIARMLLQFELKKTPGEKISAKDLAKLQRMPMSKYVLNSFDQWISSIDNIYNYDMLDVFEWEQGHGNWLAMCQLEFDIAWKDTITPFNCRELLETMLSVDPKFRVPPQHEFFKSIIRSLWPELLDIPINPHKEKVSSREGKKSDRGDLANLISGLCQIPKRALDKIAVMI